MYCYLVLVLKMPVLVSVLVLTLLVLALVSELPVLTTILTADIHKTNIYSYTQTKRASVMKNSTENCSNSCCTSK